MGACAPYSSTTGMLTSSTKMTTFGSNFKNSKRERKVFVGKGCHSQAF